MSKQTEALKLALEALELHGKQYPHMVKGYCLDAITAIREALAEQETVLPGGGHVPAVPVAVYGYCPECGGAGVMRERRPNGDDKCTNGHKYPSSKALAEQPAQQQEPVAAECKFDREEKWVRCEIAHHNLVQSEPEKWPGYQTRLLYTSPPAQRTWVGLTEQEREKLRWQALEEDAGYTQLIKATEAKLMEKNS